MKREHWEDGIILAMAAWLFFAPRVLSFDPSAHTAAWVALIASVALFLSKTLALLRPNEWEESVEFVIAILLMFSPWLLGYEDEFIPASNAILMGFLTAVVSGQTFLRALDPDAPRQDWTEAEPI
jgi:hypothetical protein